MMHLALLSLSIACWATAVVILWIIRRNPPDSVTFLSTTAGMFGIAGIFFQALAFVTSLVVGSR